MLDVAPPEPPWTELRRTLAVRQTASGRRRRVAGLIVGTALGLTVAAAGVALAWRQSAAVNEPARSGPANPAGPATTPTTAVTPAIVWPRRECPPTDSQMRGDIDGDGCDDEIVRDGTDLFAGEVRISAGVISAAVTGDWDCDGGATLVILRPSGTVWMFDGWPRGDGVTARRVDGDDRRATAIKVENRDGCDSLVISYAES